MEGVLQEILQLASTWGRLRDPITGRLAFKPHPKLMSAILYLYLVDHIAQPGSIDPAILQLEDILKDIEENDPFRFIINRSLYLARNLRFRLQGSPIDIDEGIACCQKALSCNQTLCTPSQKIEILYNLAESHIERSTWGNSQNIDSAIHYLAIALRLDPGDQPKPLALYLAGGALYARFERVGELDDLHYAIALQKQAIILASSSQDSLPSWLQKLSLSMLALFEHTKKRTDLEEGVDYIKRAIKIAGPDHPEKNRFLNTLGYFAYVRYRHTSQPADLDESVYHLNSALEVPDVEVPGRLETLTLLGRTLQERFSRDRDPTDIDRSIVYHRQRLESELRKGHIVLPLVYSDYGNALESRFNHQGETSDLRNAIWCYTKALAICPEDHPERSQIFNYLGNSLTRFSEVSKEVSHVDTAIMYFEAAMSILISAGMGNSTRIAYISGNLGQAYLLRFSYLKESDDLDNAIVHLARSAQILPESFIGLARIYAWLADAHKLRFYATNDNEDALVAMQCYHLALMVPARTSLDMMNIALDWARFCNHSEIALDPYRIVIDLLTSVISIGNSVDSQYRDVARIGDIVNEAASVAICLGKLERALEWLEAGRSIVWNQILRLRSSVDALSRVRPALAARLKELGSALEAASMERGVHKYTGIGLASEMANQARRRMGEEWNKCVQEARLVPGFDQFTRNRRATELVQAAQSGPVIIINTYQTRCDALIVLPNSEKIRHVPLKNLSVSGLKTAYHHLIQSLNKKGLRERGFKTARTTVEERLESILASLWREVVQPILETLNYMDSKPPPDEMPHVTWCTTGYLSFLPLHAAGIYNQPGSRVYDYVVSSYTTTLGVLTERATRREDFRGLLLVGQTETSGHAPLPYVSDEMQAIQRQSRNIPITRLGGDRATAEAVISAMTERSWVHFACHAKQDKADPRASGFLLHDHTLDLAMITKKPLQYADFAFLSACQTASGDESIPEEAVHLAAGMLMAGYSSVIATMWSIQDDHAPLVAEQVYAYMLKDGVPDSCRAAVALHKAVKTLRDRIGEKEFVSWVPYIHMGL